MKKWLTFFIIAALIITVWLRFVRDASMMGWDSELEDLVTRETKQVTLNNFLERYNTETFDTIILQNWVDLEGYVPFTWEVMPSGVFSFTPPSGPVYDVFTAKKPADTSLTELGIGLTGTTTIRVEFDERNVLTSILLEQVLPLVFFIFILILAFRFFWPKWWRGIPWFGSQAGKLRTGKDIKTRFTDVAGMQEVKEELVEVVDFLKNPKKYQRIWAKIPKWVLLWGQPWSGKTLIAKAIAWEANVPFFSASGSEFMEMLVGMGASKVRKLFEKAKNASPAIIFIDEIDTIWRKRWWGHTGGHQEQEQTLNQILTEMDGFDTDSNVIVIAATNRPEILDSALLRSGRFDRKIMVWKPTLEERQAILKLHTREVTLDKTVDLHTIAKRTSGFVWADLANIINEAAIRVAKQDRTQITNEDLDYALEKVIMGPEKKIKTLKDKERNIVAYHELGHAVTAYLLEHADPVEKISIVSRGMALGVTWMMPKEDSYLTSKVKFLDQMVTLLGGRAAEEIFFWKDEVTTGASNDFEKVTTIASNMILKYGMDEEIGTLIRFDKEKSEFYPFKPYSEKLAQQADAKMKTLVDTAYKRAIKIIKKHTKLMDAMASFLLEKEYITKDQFERMMENPKEIDATIETIKEEQQQKQSLSAEQTEKKVDEFLDE